MKINSNVNEGMKRLCTNNETPNINPKNATEAELSSLSEITTTNQLIDNEISTEERNNDVNKKGCE